MNSKQYWWANKNLPQPVCMWLYECSEVLDTFGYRKTSVFAFAYIVSKDFRDAYEWAWLYGLGYEFTDSALHYLKSHPFKFNEAAFHARCEWDI